MKTIARKMLEHTQVYGYGMLATLLLLMVAQTSFDSDTRLLLVLDSLLKFATTVVAAAAVAHTRARIVLVTILAIPALTSIVLEGFQISGSVESSISVPGQGLFWYVAFCLVTDLFKRRGALPTQLLTAICLYIVMAIAFSRIYLLIEQVSDSPAFTSAALADPNGTMAEYDALYFSFVTQTTLGYGDISPIAKPARAIAVIQATLGVLYIAVVVAAIVSTRPRNAEEENE